MTEERPHDDVLMSAILDEPLPPGRSADPAIAAAHRAAVADITELRAGLRLLGDTLARDPSPDPSPDRISGPSGPSGASDSSAPSPGTAPDTAPAPAPKGPRPASRRPPGRRDGRRIARRFAVGVSALTCVAALAAGVSWLSTTGGGFGASSESAKDVGERAMKPLPSDAEHKGDGDASLSPEGFVACSRLIFEGTVTRVEPVQGAPRDRITLDVERHYKPDAGPDRITLTMDHDIDPRLKPGQRTLISVPKGEDHPDNWATGDDLAELRETVLRALPGSKKVGCDGTGPRG